MTIVTTTTNKLNQSEKLQQNNYGELVAVNAAPLSSTWLMVSPCLFPLFALSTGSFWNLCSHLSVELDFLICIPFESLLPTKITIEFPFPPRIFTLKFDSYARFTTRKFIKITCIGVVTSTTNEWASHLHKKGTSFHTHTNNPDAIFLFEVSRARFTVNNQYCTSLHWFQKSNAAILQHIID